MALQRCLNSALQNSYPTKVIIYTDFQNYSTTRYYVFSATAQNPRHLVTELALEFTRTTNLTTFPALQRLIQNKNSSGSQRKLHLCWEDQTPQLPKEWKQKHRRNFRDGQGH